MTQALSAFPAADDARHACISLRLGDQLFGLRMTAVRDVTRRQPVAPVPLAPAAVLGLTQVRGRMATVIDLRAALGMPAYLNVGKQVMLVVEHAGDLYALIADTVCDVLPLALDEDAAEVSAAWSAVAERTLAVPGAGSFVLLDMEKLTQNLL